MKYSSYTRKLTFKTSLMLSMFVGILLLQSCRSDDENDNAINVQDSLILILDEHPESGQFIGNVNASSNSPLTFSILDQTFTNAIVINASTGELTVGDKSFFDFETNPSIQGVVEISNGIESKAVDVRIDLNNIEDIIALVLSESLQDYNDASNGDWIEITKNEYDELSTALLEVKKSGYYPTSDFLYAPSGDGVLTLSNLNEGSSNAMQDNSLVFAFKYFAAETQLTSDRHRVKQSSITNSTGFENIGNPLPIHQRNGGGVHFVLKGSANMITSNQGFLGFQKSAGSTMGIAVAIGTHFYALGEASDLVSEATGRALYEGLSTTIRQWD